MTKEEAPLATRARAALTKVIDPELGVDLVNLGLIYGVSVDAAGTCQVTMTLTTMGCPLGSLLNDAIVKAVTAVPGVRKCRIKLVWEPVWTIDRMSRAARLALGVH